MRHRQKKPKAKRPSDPQIITFEIDHLDPLGQGVSKLHGTVTFIAGTLPGETGSAEVFKRARGVQFAQLRQLDKVADTRIEPECPHFESCPGCQFQHTDYSSELEFKKQTLLRYLAPLELPREGLDIVPAPQRFHYRNRVQLHYRHKYIGMLDSVSDQVLEVPECKIIRSELQPEFDRLYQGEWCAKHTGHGHCELYLRQGEVSRSWDKDYAHGGFSQVNEDMNKQLQQRVQVLLEQCGSERLLDLFSGEGNLSDTFAHNGGDRVLVDRYMQTKSGNAHPLDLYDDLALQKFSRKSNTSNFDSMVLDPPRRGFPALDAWVKKIKPRHIIYVSCNPASLAHDLSSLTKKFRLTSVQLLDLFPATAHFETLVLLEMR